MEPKVDILEYIDSRIETVSSKVQQETKNMHELADFFETTKKEVERFTKSYSKALISLKSSIAQTPNSWTTTLTNFIQQQDEAVKSLLNYSNSIENEVSEPINQFAEKYENANRNILKEAFKVVDQINNQKAKVKKARERYFKDSKQVMECTTEETYRNKTRIMLESKEEYRNALNVLNNYMDTNKEGYVKLLQTWHINEERKVEHIKKALNKFSTFSTKSFGELSAVADKSHKLSDALQTHVDIKNYIPTSAEPVPQKLFDKLLFVSLDTQSPTAKVGTISAAALANVSSRTSIMPAISTSIEPSEEDLKFIESKFKLLIDDEIISEIDKSKLFSFCKTSEGLRVICTQFALLSRKIEIENLNVFTLLNELSLLVQDQLANQKFPEIGYFAALISFGSQVAHVKQGTPTHKNKKYIRETISENPIWRSKEIWQKILEFKIARSVAHLHAYMMIKQGKSPYEKEKDLGIMQKLLNAGANLIGKKTKDEAALKQEKQEESAKSGIAFTELASTTIEMALYSIDSETCRSIITEFSKEYDIERDKVYQLLSDHECAQPLPRDEDPRPREMLRYSLDRREAERKKYGYSKQTMVMGLSIKYIKDPKTLFNIMIVNKEWYNLFKYKAYKIILLSNAEKIRFSLWKTILFSQGLDSLYMKLKEKGIEEFIKNNKNIDDVIRLDVIRSFHILDEPTQLSIMTILRCYAMLNPEVEYCQGMNCIAGMLFLIYKDESRAFTMFSTLIANFGLSNLFKQDVPLLRMYFYQMNRLLAVFLPKLHAHLFEEGINATYFCSPWFLTAFTYILQFTKTPDIPLLLYEIMDAFLVSGIKALFKTSLFILEHFESKLLSIRYEGIVQFLSELPRTDFFNNPEIVKKFKDRIKYFNITSELLNRLNEEHNEIVIMSQKCMNIQHPPRQPFKHYICINAIGNEKDKAMKKLISVYFPN